MAQNSRTEILRIQDQLRRSLEGGAWHGPALLELLSEVPVDLAPAKPLEHAHSIWEIVLHIAAWQNAVARRLEGEAVSLSLAQDWPTVSDFSEEAWREAIEHLQQSYGNLNAALSKLTDEELSHQVPGSEEDAYYHLHGVIQHNLYHAGQIAVLKKSER